MRIQSNRQSPQIQAGSGVSEAAPAAAPQKTAAASGAGTGVQAPASDQYSTARQSAPERSNSASASAPDTLRRSSQPRSSEADVTLPEDKITGSRKPDRVYKDMSPKELDAEAARIGGLVRKGDPASLKAAVDELFKLGTAAGPKNFDQVMKRLHDSGDLKDLIKNSRRGNADRLKNTVKGLGTEQSWKLHESARVHGDFEAMTGTAGKLKQ